MGSTKVTNTEQNSRQENAPPSWALPGLTDLAARVTAAIPGVPGPRYEGNFYAAPNATQFGSLPLYAQAAQAAGGAAQQAQAGATAMVGGGPQFSSWQPQGFGSYDAASVQPTIEAAIQPIMRALTEQALPQMQSSALASGSYGGSRANTVLPAMVMRDFGRQAQEVGTNIAFQDFTRQQQERLAGYNAITERGLGTENLRQQGLAQLPNMLDAVMRMSTGAGDIMSQSGNMQQQWDQSAIDNQLARFQYNLTYPFQGLDTATNLLGALAGGYGTQTMNGTSKQTERTGGMAPLLGGLIGLGSMAMGMPGGLGGISSLFGGGGAAASLVPKFIGK